MSKLPFTSVVSYHTNPMTCGVAKFSRQLAGRLDVPHLGIGSRAGSYPLLSLKWSEIVSEDDAEWWVRDCIYGKRAEGYPFAVFWHDGGDTAVTHHADRVFYADPSLGSPGLWCPSLLTPRKRPVRLFSFGMAHKLQTEKYRRVRELLDAAEMPYHLRVSVGLHEGTSLDGVDKHFDALRDIMGPENVTILGMLSDDAVSEELSNADYVLAFFENGVKSNNTTVHAAIDAGRRVITNGKPLRESLVIEHMRQWPTYSKSGWSWNALIDAMEDICDRSRSTATR